MREDTRLQYLDWAMIIKQRALLLTVALIDSHHSDETHIIQNAGLPVAIFKIKTVKQRGENYNIKSNFVWTKSEVNIM